MARPMRQTRHLVVWTKTHTGDHFARRSVHRFARNTHLRCSKGRRLCLFLQIPNVALSPGRLSKGDGAADVGVIPLHRTPAIHQHHVPFLEIGRLLAPMGKGSPFSELRTNAALHTQRFVHCCTVGSKFLLRHSLPQQGQAHLVRLDGDIHGPLHQRNLRGRLDGSTGNRHRVGADELQVRRFLSDPIEKEEAHTLLHPYPPAGDTPVSEYPRHQLIRAFVLLPGTHIVAEDDHLSQPRLFEGRTHVSDLALGRDDSGRHPLTALPSDAREVEQA